MDGTPITSADRVRAAACLRNRADALYEDGYPQGYIDSLRRVARFLESEVAEAEQDAAVPAERLIGRAS